MTQNTTHIILILLGGFVGGLAGGTLLGGGAATETEPLYTADGPQVSVQSEELAERVQGLEGTLAGMEAALDGLRAELADRQREPIAPPVAKKYTGRGRGGPQSAASGAPAEEERFAAYLEKLDEEEKVEREGREAERRDERMARRMERYTSELGLDGYQSQEMSRIMTESDKNRSAYFTEMRESGSFDRESIRETMTEMQGVVNDELGQILTEGQMSDYEAMQENSRRGWGGGGGGGSGRSNGSSHGGNEF